MKNKGFEYAAVKVFKDEYRVYFHKKKLNKESSELNIIEKVEEQK